MATAIHTLPRARTVGTFERNLTAARPPLLVATDASAPSDAALIAAREIASRTRQPVRVLSVHAPVPMVSPEVQLASAPDMEADARMALESQVREQIERLGVDARWPLEIVTGSPATTIANTAARIGASLVVMGLGGHGIFDRILGDEMVLQVLRLGTTPVLAVPPSFSGLPLRVLAGLDFSASSVRALTLGAELIRPRGKLTLAHVVTKNVDPLDWSMSDAGYSGAVGRAMDRVIAEVGFGAVATVERKVLSGDPAKELLRLIEETHPDLVIAGSHGHNFLSRLLLGSVSTRLVRDANCSVLVAPPDDAPDYIEELPEERGRFAFYEWAERLEELTRRNTGTRARLEVIDPEIGAQVEERGAPFLGAAFDPRDARVHIMFAGVDGGGHLTRSISGVTAIQLLRDRFGRDVFLRVAHGRGQTLLTLER
jgi:nucleotide-binding universal stress UspA family protein